MQFTINRNAFIKKLNDVSRAIASKTTIPILSGLKIEIGQAGLTLTGSNSDISIESFLSAGDEKNNLVITEPGTIVVPAHIFGEIVKKLPDENMTISVNPETLLTTITSGQSKFNINGSDANVYPHLPDITAENQLVLKASVLKELINQVVIAVSTQETRPILTGIHFIISNGELMAVATDSHRLAQRKIELEELPKDVKYNVVIPGKSLLELSRMLTDNIDKITMRISDKQVLFILGETSFYSQLLSGKYPDTTRLIPTSANTTIEFDAHTLLAAIERASLMSHIGHNNIVRLVLNPEQQSAVLSSNSPEVGKVEESLHFIALSGESLDISFNPDYMKDALRSFGQTTITIGFTAALRPFTLEPSEDQEHFIQLITPVRTA